MNQQGPDNDPGPALLAGECGQQFISSASKSLIHDGVFIDLPYPPDKAFQKKDTHFFQLKIYGCPIF